MANRKTGEEAQEDHFNVRLPGEVGQRLRALAEREERTVSAEVRRAIKAHVEQYDDLEPAA
jgi:predicted DNA-binding protein